MQVLTRADNEAPVVLRGIGKRYKGRPAISNIDLDVSFGEVVGLVGPNGAGKSTLLKICAGLVRPSEGEGTVMGVRLDSRSRRTPFVGLMPERPAFIEQLSGRSNLQALTSIRAVVSEDAIDRVLEEVGLPAGDRQPVRTYSQGMRQRLSLAQAMIERPRLMLLDEPTNGLDPRGIVEMRGSIKRMAEEGCALVVSSHLLGEVEAVCSRVLLVDRGSVVGVHAPGEASSRTAVVVELVYPGQRTLVASIPGVIVEEATTERRLRLSVVHGVPMLIRLLVDAGVEIDAVYPAKERLEDVYMTSLGGART